ncbi:DUF3099 domain-containing protein [Desertihabitans aurantiacus]|uniref:DUF3099 domain-containing protein n=1 Tax=Desertihabitans aurantiacus TaxID=2282477 RepID=UPI000DF78DCA|nr:DUF3099 domain-containing protein [Desertihabitans aurantiacus]
MAHHDDDTPVITQASRGRSVDASRRQRNYLIMMGIRVLCFVGLWPARSNPVLVLVLLLGAVLLPYLAVLLVNAKDQRHTAATPPPEQTAPAEPAPRPAVDQGPVTIEGEVVEDDPSRPALEPRRPGTPPPPGGGP